MVGTDNQSLKIDLNQLGYRWLLITLLVLSTIQDFIVEPFEPRYQRTKTIY